MSNASPLPTRRVPAADLFGLDTPMQVDVLASANDFTPGIDPSYRFDPEVTLALLAGFQHNRRVLIQGLHGTGKSSHVEQVAARLNWPCVRVNLDGHISRMDLVGKDTLKQLPALLSRADLLVTPDSGPMHIANAMGTKVLGLHAASKPLRSGPYSDVRYCVDRYDDAARKFLGKPAGELKWGTKIEFDDVMDLVTVDDAIAAFERYRADQTLGAR